MYCSTIGKNKGYELLLFLADLFGQTTIEL